MKIINGLKRFSKYIAYASMAILFVMMLFMGTDVVLQMTNGVGILGNYEIVEIMMVCLVFFAFAYTQVSGRHIAVDLLKAHLPGTLRKILDFIISPLTSFAGVIMIIASYRNVVDVMHDGLQTATLGIKLFPFYGVVCFGCVILTLTFAVSVCENAIKLFQKD